MAEELRQAVEEYGRELRMPPEVVFDNLDVIEIKDATARAWSVLVDLWTVEEGRSDLTLEVVLTDTGGELYDIQYGTCMYYRSESAKERHGALVQGEGCVTPGRVTASIG